MDLVLQKKLFDKYPDFFGQKDLPMSQTCMCWGVECGDGWYSIIEEVCSFIQEMGRRWTFYGDEPEVKPKDRTFEFTQIKEKYGTLRLDHTTNNKTMYEMGKIMEIWAEWKSQYTCEACGQPGEMNDGPWYRVRCSACLIEEDI